MDNNSYLKNVAAIPIDHLHNIDMSIDIDVTKTTFADYVKNYFNEQEPGIVLDINQYNSGHIHIITFHGKVKQIHELVDFFYDKLPSPTTENIKSTVFIPERTAIRNRSNTTSPQAINFIDLWLPPQIQSCLTSSVRSTNYNIITSGLLLTQN